MATSTETMEKIDAQIKISNEAICHQIDSVGFQGRDVVSQTVLKLLRDFIEHIMIKIYAEEHDVEYNYNNIEGAISFVKRRGQLKFLWRFHAYLQIVASHYTLDPENSERVMIKYYEYLLKIKHFIRVQYSTDVLENIGKFPLNTDRNLQEYYEKIADQITDRKARVDLSTSIQGRYYVHNIKPFFVSQRIFYEVTFIPANGKASKFDRIIAFTQLDISKYYAVKLWTIEDNIRILEKTMPIFIIVQWEVSIRPCEIQRLSNLFGEDLQGQGSSSEYRGLMHYLSRTGFNLVELLLFADVDYLRAKR